MRIALNAQLLSEPRSGTGRYIYNLLDALGRLDSSSEYRILSTCQLPERPQVPASMRWEVMPPGGLAGRSAAMEKLFWEQRAFPRAAHTLKADIMHIPYFAPPRRTYGIPSIVTIHDVISQRLPEYRASLRLRAYTQFVARAAARAAAVIAVSNHGKQDIAATLGIPPERIYVTYEAPDPRFTPASYEAQLNLRQRLGLRGPFVLNVGGMDARKNIAGLIQAFAEVYRQFGNPRPAPFHRWRSGQTQALARSSLTGAHWRATWVLATTSSAPPLRRTISLLSTARRIASPSPRSTKALA